MRGMWSDMAGSTDWKWSRYSTHTATRGKISTGVRLLLGKAKMI